MLGFVDKFSIFHQIADSGLHYETEITSSNY
jgi:hypothetical protein